MLKLKYIFFELSTKDAIFLRYSFKKPFTSLIHWGFIFLLCRALEARQPLLATAPVTLWSCQVHACWVTAVSRDDLVRYFLLPLPCLLNCFTATSECRLLFPTLAGRDFIGFLPFACLVVVSSPASIIPDWSFLILTNRIQYYNQTRLSCVLK